MALPIPPPYLCLVTDRSVCLAQGARLEEAVAEAVEGGVNIVQLREKDLPADALLRLAEAICARLAGRALLFVNDRVDVALAAGAEGVQLGEQSLPVEAARKAAGGRLLLGRSVHSYDGAIEADRQRPDLLVVGSIFPTRSHPGAAPLGPGPLARIASDARAPVIAIGGITAANCAGVVGAGAQGVAVITAILAAPEPRAAARELRRALDVAWQSRTSRQAPIGPGQGGDR